MQQQNDIRPPLPDLDLVFVEGGEFLMGDEAGDLEDICQPVHPVKLSAFYIGKFPVTQRLWKLVTGFNPSHYKGERRPVESVSWNDVQSFIKKLNARKDVQQFLRQLDPSPPTVDGTWKFSLPTEAEWEFAARGGRLTRGSLYAGSNELTEVGWFAENSGGVTMEVGLKHPNELGIFDMSGNVWERCWDYFAGDYYDDCLKKGVVVNPTGAAVGTDRVTRGGSYFNHPIHARTAYRDWGAPGLRLDTIGFRLAATFVT